MNIKRDLTLDAMKGYCCCMMAIAHSMVIIPPGSPMDFYFSFVHANTGLFFSISGLLTFYQVKRDDLKKLLLFYFIFSLLGFSLNAIRPFYYYELNGHNLQEILLNPTLLKEPNGINFYYNIECEILQIIGIGCIFVALFSRIFKEKTIFYYITAVFFFLLFKLLSPIIPNFPMRSFIIAPGVFSILPWLIYFFAGVYIYTTPNKNNVILGTCYIILFIVLTYGFDIELSWKMKHDMSYGFFIISFAILHFSFFTFRLIGNYIKKTSNFFVFLGEHSLLYFYIHFYMCYLFLKFKLIFWFIAWPLIIFSTFIMILGLNYINKKIKIQINNIFFWSVLILLIFITPFLFSFNIKIIIHIEFIYGLIFALRYRELSLLIKKSSRKVTQN